MGNIEENPSMQVGIEDIIDAVKENEKKPTTRPKLPVICPYCGSSENSIVWTKSGAFGHLRPDICARQHECSKCMQKYWTYTNELTRIHKVSTYSWSRLNRMLRVQADLRDSADEEAALAAERLRERPE